MCTLSTQWDGNSFVYMVLVSGSVAYVSANMNDALLEIVCKRNERCMLLQGEEIRRIINCYVKERINMDLKIIEMRRIEKLEEEKRRFLKELDLEMAAHMKELELEIDRRIEEKEDEQSSSLSM